MNAKQKRLKNARRNYRLAQAASAKSLKANDMLGVCRQVQR